MTQAELAKALGKSQPMVSGAEGGSISVSARYVKAVLMACGLPEDWAGSKTSRASREERLRSKRKPRGRRAKKGNRPVA